jgi:diguanylate cyclase (GGDEF)-like protein
MAAAIALTHHERWDGNGYPRGLEGEQIPLEGRVAAVADVFDALLSDRPYRPAMTADQAVEIVTQGRGTHFDPLIVDILLENLEEILTFRLVVELPTIFRERGLTDGGSAGEGALDHASSEPVSLDGMTSSQAIVSASVRDAAAERRDRAAEGRDLAAQARDRDDEPEAAGPNGASRDRREAAEDRRQAARDRISASHELAYEGIDSLTGVLRRRVGLAAIQREMDRCERIGEPLVLAFVDTVGLKAINDTRGHAAGDRVLKDIAGCISDALRSYDLITRVGGDEFVCTFSPQTVPQAVVRYREISQRLAESDSGARMTVGLAAQRPGDSLDVLVDRADQAMLGARRR